MKHMLDRKDIRKIYRVRKIDASYPEKRKEMASNEIATVKRSIEIRTYGR